MSVYITGDVHGNPSRLNAKSLATLGIELVENDKVIICGDFGLPWYDDAEDKYWLDWLAAKPFEILFVDGNHENFDLLNKFPIGERYGGKVHILRENVFHLMRGEIYEIEGDKYFAFGGATSADKYLREENISWWKEENFCQKEYDNAMSNLAKVNFIVNYVVTHTAPKRFLGGVPFDTQGAENCKTAIMLDRLESKISYRKWFVGHFHLHSCDEISKVAWMYKGMEKIQLKRS